MDQHSAMKLGIHVNLYVFYKYVIDGKCTLSTFFFKEFLVSEKKCPRNEKKSDFYQKVILKCQLLKNM